MDSWLWAVSLNPLISIFYLDGDSIAIRSQYRWQAYMDLSVDIWYEVQWPNENWLGNAQKFTWSHSDRCQNHQVLRHTGLYPPYWYRRSWVESKKWGSQYDIYLLALAEPKTGLTAPLVFFLPIVFSLCSFCFSFARVVSADATLRTSMSLRGAESSRTWCSTKVG